MVKKLAILGVHSVGDLLQSYPRRYDDYSHIEPIDHIKPGQVTIRAVIKQAKGRYVGRGLHVTEAVASDETGSVRLVWFNQPYRAAALKADTEYFISGDFGLRRQHLSIQNPSVEMAESFPISTARIVPIYRETKGFKSHQLRKLLRNALPIIRALPETLPNWLVEEHKLVSYAEAIEAIHFPQNQQQLAAARHRLGFEEVFGLSLAAMLNKQELLGEHALSVGFDKQLAQDFVGHLPFQLTDAQRQVAWRIYQDMQRDQPMNRLVEGDVGSGKTVVAVMAAIMAIRQGFQVAFMAPTELLARQHAETILGLLQSIQMADQVVLLVGGQKPIQKRAAQAAISSGHAKCIIGTHALIQEKVDMNKLGLIVVDEQHRFGVAQRKKLQAKAGHMPHVLHLTATPIPRSLALTLYGELDVSIIDSKPLGRKPIHTELISPNSVTQLYNTVDKRLEEGEQMFVVCPLISESDVMPAKSAEQVYHEFATKTFKHRRVGLLHGKMKSDQKDAIMRQFIEHQLDVLVATTVVEVGVDVPNATIMMIQNAERFGLAQLHQLRGRVGRSSQQGYCYLILGESAEPGRRLRALENTNDGFKLAEMDLEIRGPGAIYGTLQHGQLDLRVATLTDTKLIMAAKSAAATFLTKREKLVQYKQLSDRVKLLRSITNLN